MNVNFVFCLAQRFSLQGDFELDFAKSRAQKNMLYRFACCGRAVVEFPSIRIPGKRIRFYSVELHCDETFAGLFETEIVDGRPFESGIGLVRLGQIC